MSEKAETSSAVETAEVAAHTLLLRRGTYCIYVVAVSPGLSDAQLPGLGVSAAPGEQNNTLELARLSGDPWLRQLGDALLLRVHAETVRLLLTSYNTARAKGAIPPKIEIQRLDAPPPVTLEATVPVPVDNRAADVVVHVRNLGDIKGQFGDWLSDPAGNLWIEGFTIATPPGIDASSFHYQAVLGKGWTSPWISAGEYCGTRGLQIPIQGLRLRVDHENTDAGLLLVSVRYADGTVQERLPVDSLCALDPLQPVTGLRIEVVNAPAPKSVGTSRVSRRSVGGLIGRRAPAPR